VRVVRVYEERYIEETPIAFETRWEPDPAMELDTSRIAYWGREGAQRRRILVRYENGQEITRTQEEEWVAHEPQARVYKYGTQVVVRQVDTPSGTVSYWRKLRLLATSYSAATAGTPVTSSNYGYTRSGLPARTGVVAVDPSVISLMEQVYVPGYGVGLAADTGGGIKGLRIDLCYDNDSLVHWARWVDVYLLTPVPGNIPYVLPNTPVERD
jgi:3D (Asp-Asp-Asp) domain-containing protein